MINWTIPVYRFSWASFWYVRNGNTFLNLEANYNFIQVAAIWMKNQQYLFKSAHKFIPIFSHWFITKFYKVLHHNETSQCPPLSGYSQLCHPSHYWENQDQGAWLGDPLPVCFVSTAWIHNIFNFMLRSPSPDAICEIYRRL